MNIHFLEGEKENIKRKREMWQGFLTSDREAGSGQGVKPSVRMQRHLKKPGFVSLPRALSSA